MPVAVGAEALVKEREFNEKRNIMDFILWLVVIGLFIISFVALLYPVLPSVAAVWGGFLIYHFFIDPTRLSTFFWISMVLLTILLLVADLFASSISVNKFGGSKLGERSATLSVIIGSFIFPPFGMIILPFVVVLLVELLQKRPPKEAVRASVGSLVGFLTGQFAEGILQLIMILWFFLNVWFGWF